MRSTRERVCRRTALFQVSLHRIRPQPGHGRLPSLYGPSAPLLRWSHPGRRLRRDEDGGEGEGRQPAHLQSRFLEYAGARGFSARSVPPGGRPENAMLKGQSASFEPGSCRPSLQRSIRLERPRSHLARRRRQQQDPRGHRQGALAPLPK